MSDFNETPLYPFRFEPIYKKFSWGGTRFASIFHRPLSKRETFAESWELADLEKGGNVITNGYYAGKMLHELITLRSDDFFRSETRQLDRFGCFPLTLKFIDAQGKLDLHVHPSDTGKSVVWLVLDAEPDAVIYAGFDQSYSRRQVESALHEGRFESLLQKMKPNVGDCFVFRPGVVHSAANGLLLAEVQTTDLISNPFYTWNSNKTDRADNNILGLEKALPLIRYDVPLVQPQLPQRPPFMESRSCELLARCEEFIVNRWTFDEVMIWSEDYHCHIWSVLQGAATAIFHLGRRSSPGGVSGRQSDPIYMEKLQQGDTILVPPLCRSIQWTSDGDNPVVLLDILGT